jgi:glyoxylase-like metal-dependent hydrolase (beta-lactamase superfamily II)/ferredoxin
LPADGVCCLPYLAHGEAVPAARRRSFGGRRLRTDIMAVPEPGSPGGTPGVFGGRATQRRGADLLMANWQKRLAENEPGDFFVDSTCINCDTCRHLAPAVFGEAGEFSFVRAQPCSEEGRRRAWRALLACPTGSIGSRGPNRAAEVRGDFPLHLEDGVYYCGFNSPKSFGGNSYFVRHPAGNWLVDSPKWLPHLLRTFEDWGGVRWIFLTHEDDVAEADRYARHFGARRVIHRAELDAQPDAEQVLDGDEPVEFAPGFRAIPTPGHTCGHCVLLYERFLFTGDHLDADRDTGSLSASRDYCWYSWEEQTRSMARLLDYRFEWVLPGHGQRVRHAPDVMRRHLEALVRWMRGMKT